MYDFNTLIASILDFMAIVDQLTPIQLHRGTRKDLIGLECISKWYETHGKHHGPPKFKETQGRLYCSQVKRLNMKDFSKHIFNKLECIHSYVA